MPCVAARAAPSRSRSPVRRATIADVAIANPMASANTSVTQDSVRPTVATAFAPSLETKNTSQTANTLSMIISSTMGMARIRIACETVPSVKSRCVPRSASRIAAPSETVGGGAAPCAAPSASPGEVAAIALSAELDMDVLK